MIEYLKAKKHKGISELKLSQLGHINVLCGKNNSGKTSILEALDYSKKSFTIGKKVEPDDKTWLKELFSMQTEKWGYNKGEYRHWFSKYLDDFVALRPIWFYDEIDEIVQEMKASQEKYKNLTHSPDGNVNYKEIIESYFNKSTHKYITEFINPKRAFAYKCNVISGEKGCPQDIVIANRLFHLKNQNPDSDDYKKFGKIYSAFRAISDYHFNIALDDGSINLFFSKDGKNWIKGESCGLGLADVLIMITISIDSNASIIFIEEPENHLHPEIQKRFLHFIKDIRSKQFILSTHSSVFLDPFLVDKIFYVYFDGEVKVTDETSKSEILYILGYSVADNLVADMIILTEGPSDIPILETIFKWMEINGKCNIKFWPLCGDVMTHLDLSVIAETKNVWALIDSDPNSGKSRTRFIRKCREAGIYCKKLERYSIENYFTLNAIRKIFTNIPDDLIELKPDKKVDDQIGFSKNDKSIKQKNRQIIEQMSITDIESTDLFKFCEKIRKHLEKNQLIER
ncbi:MAG TPA: ATP-binding protein [Methanothrix sp.]|nr:ATP-binding protein [Methanothrix sp.]